MIEALEETGSYKYLGFLQLKGIKQKEIKEAIRNKFVKRLNLILKTKINTHNKIIAINTYADLSLLFRNNKLDQYGLGRPRKKAASLTY